MNKIIYIPLALFLFISCDNGVTLDNLCLYTDSSVVVGTNVIPKQRSESIVVDRYANSLWIVKHTEKKIIVSDFNDSQVCFELSIEDGTLNYLYEDYLFNGKFISRAIFDNIQKLVIFDIFSGLYKIIEINMSMPYRICGLDNCYIYLYTNDNSVVKVNFLTLEKEEITLGLHNPGYCVEEESFIGISENNNICILKDNIMYELPIKGIRYKNNIGYVDISNLYYYTNNKIYYTTKDSFGYIKAFFTLTFFLDGLGPIQWYCYDLETKKIKKINNKGNSFLCDLRIIQKNECSTQNHVLKIREINK